MDPTTKQTLVKAIQLVKSGDNQAAVPILAGLLKKEPTLIQAWYLLGLAVDVEDRKIKAFKQVLKLDPDHEKAKAQLAKLEATPPAPKETPAPSPPSEEQPAVETETPPPAIHEDPAWQPADVTQPEPEQEPESFPDTPIEETPVETTSPSPEVSEEPAWQPPAVHDPEPEPEKEPWFPDTPIEDTLVESTPPPPEVPEATAWQPPEAQAPESESEPDSEPLQEETPPFPEESPFVEEPDQGTETPSVKPIEDTPLPTDFDLPDWMDQESFDPNDYGAPDDDEIYLNTDAEIPEWAQMNPFDAPAEPEEEPVTTAAPPEGDDTYRPLWSDEDTNDKYSGSYDDAPEVPDWAASSYGDDAEPDSSEYYSKESDPAGRVEAFFEKEDQAEEDQEEVEESEPADPEGDDSDWLQEMVDEEKKGRKRRKKSLTPSEKKRRRRIIIYIFLLILAAVAGTAGYLFQDELQPYWLKVKPYVDKVADPIKTQAYPISVLLTEDAPLTNMLTPGFFTSPTPTNTVPVQPTAVPTRTPGPTLPPPTATLQATLLPGETPTITPTPVPLPDEVSTLMDQIESQVEGVRGLQGPENTERLMLANSVLRQEMATFLINDESAAMLADQEIVLEALGFINANYNLADSFLSTLADELGGYYLPSQDRIYVIGNYADGFGALEQFVYAHEYAHAIQDANHDLTSLGIFPFCTGPNQACQATRALVEGEANLVSQTWLDQFPPSGGLSTILNYDPNPMLFQTSSPPYFEMGTVFEDTYGADFVQYLFDNGGWNSVNRAFSVLPTTTEQILHPEKYQQRETAFAINAPDYSSLLSQEWELITEDSLGEWDSFLLLAHNDYTNARQPEDDAAIAAEGWGADKYQVYYNPEERQVFLSVYWVWDTNEDSTQFFNLLKTSLNSRFGAAELPSEAGETCWFYQGQKSCIQKDANKVYWLMSDNSELLDTVRERFRLFP